MATQLQMTPTPIQDRATPARPPLVLIASDQEWSTRSLESILWPNGYAVLRAYTGRKALDRARSAQPDLIIVDANLPDVDSLSLTGRLRTEARIRASTPILMTAPVRPSRQQRLAALRAGAWEYLSYPLDAEELMLRLDGYMRAKFEADQARQDALLDETTGLYNLRGLERRARELGSHAFRNHWPLACVVIAAEDETESSGSETGNIVNEVTNVFARVFRISDAVGRLGEREFAIIAPGTDANGAVKIADRLARALATREGATTAMKLRAGYDAVTDYHENPVELMDMVARATTALRMSRHTSSDADTQESWIQQFEDSYQGE